MVNADVLTFCRNALLMEMNSRRSPEAGFHGPDFLVIGAPKCGTTALAKSLEAHPAIYISPWKEPHYYTYVGSQQPDWACSTFEQYAELFSKSVTETVRGEASTWYLYCEAAAEAIYEHVPQCKVIALLRDPVERAFSSWAFRVQSSWEPISDFEAAIAAEPQRIQDGWSWDHHYLQAGFYAPQLQRYYDRFDPRQIRVYLYEDFLQNPGRILHDLYQFLGVDCAFVPETSRRHNVTMFPKSPLLNRLLTRSGALKSLASKLLPGSIRAEVARRLRRANAGPKPQLPHHVWRRLIGIYREDIRRVEALTGLNCDVWRNRPRPPAQVGR